MLEIYSNLFYALKAENITFCNWKSIHATYQHLNGEGDLDLYVPINFREQFEEVSQIHGFRRVNSYQSSHSFIEHYFGFDEQSCKFAHIHLYFKFITGEHASKNYDLPIENFILNNIDSSQPLPTLTNAGMRSIFLLRYFLKIGSLYGIFQYLRELKKYSLKWNFFDHHFKNFESIPEINIASQDFDQMKYYYEESNFLLRFLHSLKIKRLLKKHRRRFFLEHLFFNINNLILRLWNRFFLKKKKIFSPGIIVAICGLDGSGKSSLVSALEKNMTRNFCTKVFHLGRPSSTAVTFIFNFFISPLIFLKKFKKPYKQNHFPRDKIQMSLISAIRSVILAYDRKAQSDKALYYKNNGYFVICDRYPGIEIGKMDSPRIPLNNHKGFLYKSCYKLEQRIYRSIQPASLIFHLSVPLEIAIKRNQLRNKFGKETEEELRTRYLINSKARFLGKNYVDVDASIPFEKVLQLVTKLTWNSEVWK